MPVRATKRGDARTPLSGEYDVIVCGASFAGLAVARELSGSGARVLLLDRYEIGEKQTSACAAPTEFLENLGVAGAIRQTFSDLVIHRRQAHGGRETMKTYRWHLPWTFSTFDYREICALLKEQSPDVPFETAKVEGRTGETIRTDRGDLTAPLIVDGLGWPRYLSESGQRVTPPNARVSRGLEVHPDGSDSDLELWLDPKYVRAGYSWNFPAGDELRVGVGSFDPHDHVKRPTQELAADLGLPAERWQGNWIPHKMRKPTDGIVFFVGDSAGHCFPTTAEGIRPALYFGLACGRELRKVVEGRQTRAQALDRYAAFCDEHLYAFRWLLRVQNMVGRLNRYPAMDTALDIMDRQSFVTWSFNHYLNITPPDYVLDGPHGDRFRTPLAAPVAVAA
ncbi:FAD-dependent oxidoreductase [Paraconexibacter sp.]|uniref:FAD-dependent oxidoreductase n=1 Tax=Paraconexibacter sp. TaxID=2949640 RepID=UPI00356357AA